MRGPLVVFRPCNRDKEFQDIGGSTFQYFLHRNRGETHLYLILDRNRLFDLSYLAHENVLRRVQTSFQGQRCWTSVSSTGGGEEEQSTKDHFQQNIPKAGDCRVVHVCISVVHVCISAKQGDSELCYTAITRREHIPSTGSQWLIVWRPPPVGESVWFGRPFLITAKYF